MATKVRDMQDTKQAMLEAGIELFLQNGYSNTGVQEVLDLVNIPKGCFYHYFQSKELFALAVIRYFDKTYADNVYGVLEKRERTAVERLREYCRVSTAVIVGRKCKHGCLISNLSQEMSAQSDLLRNELVNIQDHRRDMFAACIEDGQKNGEIKSHRPARDLAELFMSGWNGVTLRAKSLRNTEPLDIFVDFVFSDLLKAA